LSNDCGELLGVTTQNSRKDPAFERFQRRAAAAEINGRQVNEAIEPRGPDGSAVFVCECGHFGCGHTVQMPVAEYESVRTSFDRFLLVPGHEIEEVDKVVERYENYLVVIKREPEAREMAKASDERSP
jgi:ribosome-binding protein aMBF1 (putative translation factor)